MTKTEVKKTNIKEARNKLKISQAKLAQEAKIDLRYFQRIEAGEHAPSVYIAITIAKILKTNVENLFPFFD